MVVAVIGAVYVELVKEEDGVGLGLLGGNCGWGSCSGVRFPNWSGLCVLCGKVEEFGVDPSIIGDTE